MARLMSRNRGFAVALAVSVSVHLLLLLLPGMPSALDESPSLPPLSAHLAPLRPISSGPAEHKPEARAESRVPEPRPQKPRPQPRPAPAADALPLAGTDTPEVPDAPPGGEAPAAAPSEPAQDALPPEPAAQPAESGPGATWAISGRIQYKVIHGDSGFVIGRTSHVWAHDGKRYSMETVIETTGLVALVTRFRMVQRSEGRILPEGLRPDTFTVERDGEIREQASFDWERMQVTYGAGTRRRVQELRPGDQDVVSLAHHLSMLPEDMDRMVLLVVTGKSAVQSVIQNQGVEEIDVPAGHVVARHLGSMGHRGDLRIDIWLARDYANLPVRIKITDKGGDVLDQVATGVELGPRSPVQ